MKEYQILIEGNDIYMHMFCFKCDSFKQAFDCAQATVKSHERLTIEQLRIVRIEEL